MDDELSSGRSPLPDLPPLKNNVEVASRKRPSRRSSWFVNIMPRQVRREFSRERRQSEHAPENIPAWQVGAAPSLLFRNPTFGAAPASYMPAPTAVRGPEDMLLSPLGQYILSYEPPFGFVIPPFAMYDGTSDPYDHMLHFNQAMIMSARNDRILCKVFPASLKGLALTWFHKLPRGSINSFSELWAAFVSQYLCSVRQKGNISSLQTIFKREDESIRDFTRRFGQAVQKINAYNIDAVLKNFRRSFRPTTPFFQLLSLDPPATMEEPYRRVDKYSTLEHNIWAASQTVMITTQNSKPTTKGQPEQKGSQSKNQKSSWEQSERKREPPQFTPLNISYDRLSLSSGITLTLNGLHQFSRIPSNAIDL